jgi:hypothetical protein
VIRQTGSGRSAWQWVPTVCAVLIGLSAPALAAAQAPSALKRGVSGTLPKDADALGQFETQYRAAHSPRILLFWNVSFDDETRSTAAAVEVTFYTRAQPPAPPRTGRYVGTDEGFKWQSPPPWVPPVDQVGRTLAEEVMITLARAFGAAPTSSSPGAP